MKHLKNFGILSVIILILLLTACKSDSSSQMKVSGNTAEIELKEPTLIIVSLTEDQLYKKKTQQGDVDFYTIAEGESFNLNEINRKMSLLDIPVLRSHSDTINIQTNKSTETIIKDDNFGIFNYFFFDGEKLEKKKYEELMAFE